MQSAAPGPSPRHSRRAARRLSSTATVGRPEQEVVGLDVAVEHARLVARQDGLHDARGQEERDGLGRPLARALAAAAEHVGDRRPEARRGEGGRVAPAPGGERLDDGPERGGARRRPRAHRRRERRLGLEVVGGRAARDLEGDLGRQRPHVGARDGVLEVAVVVRHGDAGRAGRGLHGARIPPVAALVARLDARAGPERLAGVVRDDDGEDGAGRAVAEVIAHGEPRRPAIRLLARPHHAFLARRAAGALLDDDERRAPRPLVVGGEGALARALARLARVGARGLAAVLLRERVHRRRRRRLRRRGRRLEPRQTGHRALLPTALALPVVPRRRHREEGLERVEGHGRHFLFAGPAWRVLKLESVTERD